MSIRKQSLIAIAWNSMGGIVNLLIAFVISVIISRILGPSEYGLLAIAMSFIAFSEGMVNMGFHTSIIRHKNIKDIDLSSIFVLNLALGLFFTMLFYSIAPIIQSWYEMKDLALVIRSLSIVFIINGSTLVHRAYLERNLAYKWINLSRVSSLIISGIIAIQMAYQGFGIWSLVTFNLSIAIITAIILFIKSGWKPSFAFSLETVKEHWSFSSQVFGANLITTIAKRMDVLILGKYISVDTLGLFNRGKSLNEIATRVPAQFVLKPLFSSLSKIQSDLKNLKTKLNEIIRMISFIFIPVFVFVIVYAQEIVVFLYGTKWIGSVPYLQIFLAMGILHILRVPYNYLLLARGRSNKIMRLELILNTIKIISIIILAPINIMYLLYGLFGIKIIEYLSYAIVANKEIKEKLYHHISIGFSYLILSIIIVSLFNYGLFGIEISLIKLFLIFVFYISCYIIINIINKSPAWVSLLSYYYEFRVK